MMETQHSILTDLRNTLEEKGFTCIVLNTDKEVKDFIAQQIPDETPVGLGNSITTCKLKIRNLLVAKGIRIFYSWDGSENYNRSLDTFEDPERPDYYITRLSALTVSGEILLNDYQKQAAEQNNFPGHMFAFVGANRIVDSLSAGDSLQKYPVISKCPEGVKFFVALLPFLDY
ncbi:MAG: LUD domain-containing protein [Bacteroidales bacterium]|nr:LUD domain-containing protein [Bacteroidales bacterium]